MPLSTEHLERCIRALELGLKQVRESGSSEVTDYALRLACVKEFELILIVAPQLIQQRIIGRPAPRRYDDRPAFKDVFRAASNRGLLDADSCRRWIAYHEFFPARPEEPLAVLPQLPDFLTEAKRLVRVLRAD